MKKLRTVIVDDEWLIRLELRNMLAEYPQIEMIGEASTFIQACELIHQEKPDLIFLDIELPGGSGLDILDDLDYNPSVIILTAYDKYLIKILHPCVTEFLLKPINQKKIKTILQTL
ncbi:response regulator [candidate division KSB1 bacterium]|nr:response regulator [candidate division KSB1 bacterium]